MKPMTALSGAECTAASAVRSAGACMAFGVVFVTMMPCSASNAVKRAATSCAVVCDSSG